LGELELYADILGGISAGKLAVLRSSRFTIQENRTDYKLALRSPLQMGNPFFLVRRAEASARTSSLKQLDANALRA